MEKIKIQVNHKLGFGTNVALMGIGVGITARAFAELAKVVEAVELRKQCDALAKLGKVLDDIKSDLKENDVKEEEES